MFKSNELTMFQKNQSLYESFVEKLIDAVPVHGTFVDCGAHVGTHTRNMLRRFDINNVIAIEAIPDLAERLSRQFANETRLTIIQTAIGNIVGFTDFNVAQNSPGYSGIIQRDISDVTNWVKLNVPITKCDALAQITESTSPVSFMKLDLEGGEFNALQGSMQLILRDRPLLVFENGLSKSAAHYNYSKTTFFEFFSSIDYVIYDFFGNQVDDNYWDTPLFTYMFVALPSNGLHAVWYFENREKLLASVLGDDMHP